MSELKTLPGQRVVCLGKTVPLFTQEYEWVPAICQGSLMKCKGGGGNLVMDLHLIQGGNYDTSGHFILRKLR